MAEIDTNDPAILKKLSREQLLEVSTQMIEGICDRVAVNRFKPRNGDEIKLKHFRVLISALQLHATLLKDEQLESIEERLTALEANNGKQSTR